ncbi:NYN domain-containing protein [Allostreptomyces psammosilenae]|uniref:NYN domain-containing protein n=1 Tax=Allostreptomyces psammosilenae TaxID=1892865 RepID=UPI001FE29A51|nr:NYN domain-containing protein [Allostreptomyces psammosilenae]
MERLEHPLPAPVRQRVVGVAADALGSMPGQEVPPALRRYARFTPSRRARLAGTPIAAALESDATFRHRIAERLRAGQPELAGALETGSAPPAADPMDVAAAAYLLRPAGWTRLVAESGRAAEQAESERTTAEALRTAEQLSAELAAAKAAARADGERLRAELEALRRESDGVRRKLRSAEAQVKRAEAELRKVVAELEQVRSAAAAAQAQADGDARRLRNRLADAEAALEASRRASREDRGVADMRLRLLLDTVLDAANGLRRELAVPPTTQRPADSVEAVEPVPASPLDVAARALAADDPEILEQLLALPHVHLVVDGYNVTKAGYPALPLEKQRERLLSQLAMLAASTAVEVTCVFDGADLGGPVPLAAPRGVRVLFSRPGETADELIRRLVRAEPRGRPLVVASSDREVADGVRKAGARPVPSSMLLRRFARG